MTFTGASSRAGHRFTVVLDRGGMTGWKWVRTVLTASVTAGCTTAALVALTATSDDRRLRAR